MPYQDLPSSDAARMRMGTKAKIKNNSIIIGDRVLTPALGTRLDIIVSKFGNDMEARGFAFNAEVTAKNEKDAAFDKNVMFMVDFIEVFNRGVKRGKYLAADRVLYLIPESDTNELVITTEENATLWGDRIKLGEIARMALPGRVAMSNPTIDEVNTTTLEYANKLIAHSNIMQDYIDAQLLVKGDCTEMDIVLEKVAGQLHTNYSELDAPTRRRYMRQYGVPFSSKISLTFNFLITNSITHTTVDGTVLLEETGLERVAIHGMAQMVSIVADEATFLITHPDFHNQEIVEDLTTGVTTFDINVALVPLI